jgi:hypothetical protein
MFVGILARHEEQITNFSRAYTRMWTGKSALCQSLIGGQEHNVLTRVMGNTEEHGNASVNGPAVFFWPAMVRP